MYRMIQRSPLWLVYAALVLGLTGCGASPFGKKDPVAQAAASIEQQTGPVMWESGLQYVKIVPTDIATLNQHPQPISPEDLRAVFEYLYVSQSSLLRTSQVPLFSPGELGILTPAIARALGQVSANQDITFVSLGVHPGMIASERKTNSARVFVDGTGRLNMVFGLIHEEYREKDQFTGQAIDRRVNPLLPGTRTRDAEVKSRVLLDNGLSFFLDPNTGTERGDWLVIDVPTVLAAMQERKGDAPGTLSPEMMEDLMRTRQEAINLREDVNMLKEIIFELTDEVERLRQQTLP